MKRLLSILMIVVLIFSLTACGDKGGEVGEVGDGDKGGEVGEVGEDGEDEDEDKPLRVALLLNGVLGDKSFFDSANRGLQMAKEEFGDKIEFKPIEMTTDETKWKPTLYDYCDDGTWDIIIVGTWQLLEPLEEIAPKYPDQKFILFDETMNYDNGAFPNVHSILYKQNEVSFLAGALAARITTSEEMEKVNPSDKIIGFLGGTENATINDFLIGYIEGAKYIEEDIKVVISFVGNFYDTPKGKDLALAQYQQNGVDIGFNVAGRAGLGQIDAAVDTDKYAIGVDSDQAVIMGEPKANYIPASALKNVDNSIHRAMSLALEGKLEYGKSESLGIKEGGVAISDNDYYKSMVPQSIRDEIAELSDKIENGEIEVDTAFGKTTEEIQAIKDSVR